MEGHGILAKLVEALWPNRVWNDTGKSVEENTDCESLASSLSLDHTTLPL